MILKLRSVAAIITFVAFTSCATDKDKDYVDKSLIPTESELKAKQADSNAAVIQNPNAVSVNMPSAAAPNIPGITSPVNLSQTPQALNVQPMATNVTTSPVVTPAGMNPPHGEPNHRCDIAVGAPLSSKPANAAQATTINTTPPALLTPAKTDSSNN